MNIKVYKNIGKPHFYKNYVHHWKMNNNLDLKKNPFCAIHKHLCDYSM